MLKEISIKDVVLIEALELSIGSGFIALTGETGAGKSILLDALGLALGNRADKGLVRNGANKAITNAIFEINNDYEIKSLLDEYDIEIEDNLIALRRSLGLDGKSRAFINDISVTNALLKEISAKLIEIHGQHSAIGLMDNNTHGEILDNFLCFEFGDEFKTIKDKTKSSYSNLLKAQKKLEQAKEATKKSGAERDYLAHIYDELKNLNPQKGEEAALDSERRFLTTSERITDSIKEALDIITGAKLESNIANAARAISKIGLIENDDAKKLSELIENAGNALEKSLNELNDASSYLTQAGYAIDLDPKHLENIEERLFELRAAARKHSVNVDDLNEVLQKTQEKLAMIDNCDEILLQSQKEYDTAKSDYINFATQLSNKRIDGALIFQNKIMDELPPLKLEKMRFKASIKTDSNKFNNDGFDKIIFEIAPNPGAGFGDLSQIASGGELSRLSLALKVVLAKSNDGITLIFDEVDQGIGGATADAVGRRLEKLAQNAQVICVTHSPQVAARANYHLKIEKSTINGITHTNVRQLSNQEREEELARMLSGEDISDEARAAARKLVSQ